MGTTLLKQFVDIHLSLVGLTSFTAAKNGSGSDSRVDQPLTWIWLPFSRRLVLYYSSALQSGETIGQVLVPHLLWLQSPSWDLADTGAVVTRFVGSACFLSCLLVLLFWNRLVLTLQSSDRASMPVIAVLCYHLPRWLDWCWCRAVGKYIIIIRRHYNIWMYFLVDTVEHFSQTAEGPVSDLPQNDL